MARILICEPADEVRALFSFVVERLGHEPVHFEQQPASSLADIEVVLLEPADVRALRIVEELRAERPYLPVVCVSIHTPTPELMRLHPVAFLVKPLKRAELDRVLRDAVNLSGVAERASK